MKLQDRIKLLANRINQPHYIEYHFKKAMQEAYLKGVKDTEEKQLSLCSVVNSMPTEREIKLQARKVENYIGGESDLKAAEKTGKFHGFLKGVEWLSNKLN